MNPSQFRENFLRTGPGGANSYREVLTGTVEALGELFESVSAPYSGLDIGQLESRLAAQITEDKLGRQGVETVVGQAIDLVAQHSIIVQHPHCIAHLHTPPLLPALAAEVVISALNQSMDSWDQASAATHVEMLVVNWFASRFGFGEGDGTFTSGGTQGNYMGLLLARDECCRQVSGHNNFEQGLPDYAAKLRVVISKTTHFSIVKSLAQLGLGSRALVAVDCDAAGRMLPAALERALAKLDTAGLIPMAVVATAGTTDHGAVDPIAQIAQICRARDLWMHVDAAVGGALILTGQRGRLAGIEHADSLALDFHKFFFQPISCGLFLLRDPSHFLHLEHHADYLNRESDPRPNLVEKSVATTRRFDALKMWMTLKTIGPEGLAAMVERVIDLTRYAADLVRREPRLELLAEPQLSTVLFRFAASGPEPGTAEEVNRQLHEELLSSGRAIIGRTALRGSIALKLTLLNPCLEEADLDSLVELLVATGSRLEALTEAAPAV